MTRAEAAAIAGPVPDRFLVEILETAPTPGELIEAVCRVRADDAVLSDTGARSAAPPMVARAISRPMPRSTRAIRAARSSTCAARSSV